MKKKDGSNKSFSRKGTILPKQDLSEVFIPIRITEEITTDFKGPIELLDRKNCVSPLTLFSPKKKLPPTPLTPHRPNPKKKKIYGKALVGKGTMSFPNGNKYQGEFHRGMIHGKNPKKNKTFSQQKLFPNKFSRKGKNGFSIRNNLRRRIQLQRHRRPRLSEVGRWLCLYWKFPRRDSVRKRNFFE